DRRERVLKQLASYSLVCNPLRVDSPLERMASPNPAHVIDDLRDALIEVEPDRVTVADAGSSNLRLPAHRHCRTIHRHPWCAELMTTCVLKAQLVEHRA